MREMLSPIVSPIMPLLIKSMRVDGCSRESSCLATSGKAEPKDKKPVVDDEPSATMMNVCPGRSFSLVNGRLAPSDSPDLKVRQAAEGLKVSPRSRA